MRARVLYERLVTFFPTSGRYWRLYIEQEVIFTLSSSSSASLREYLTLLSDWLSATRAKSCGSSAPYGHDIVCCHGNHSIEKILKCATLKVSILKKPKESIITENLKPTAILKKNGDCFLEKGFEICEVVLNVFL